MLAVGRGLCSLKDVSGWMSPQPLCVLLVLLCLQVWCKPGGGLWGRVLWWRPTAASTGSSYWLSRMLLEGVLTTSISLLVSGSCGHDLSSAVCGALCLASKPKHIHLQGRVALGCRVSCLLSLAPSQQAIIFPLPLWQLEVSSDIALCPLGDRVIPSWEPLTYTIS